MRSWGQIAGVVGAVSIDDVVHLTSHFCASLKHKDDGQTKFIKPNSQRQDIIIKYWVSIGRFTESRVDFKCRVHLVKLRFKRSFK